MAVEGGTGERVSEGDRAHEADRARGAFKVDGTGIKIGVISDGVTSPAEHSFVRHLPAGRPQDTGDNASDFVLVSTDGPVIDGAPSRLGAPGPEGAAPPAERRVLLPPQLTPDSRPL